MKKHQIRQSKQTLLVESNILLDKIKSLETSKNDLEIDLKNSKNMNKRLVLQNKELSKIKSQLLKELKNKKVILINFAKTVNEKLKKLEAKSNQAYKRLKYVESLNEEFLQVMDEQEKKLENISEQRAWLAKQLVESVKENMLQDDKNNNTDLTNIK